MATLTITCVIDDDDEYADLNHPMGVTDEGYTAIVLALSGRGLGDVDIKLADS